MCYLCVYKNSINMKILGILTAMSVEYNQLAAMMEEQQLETDGNLQYLTGQIGPHRVILQQCGIGKVNAAMCATLMIRRYQPTCIISTGVAGGVDPAIRVMDVVVSTQQVYHDMWCGPGNAWGQVQGLPELLASDSTLLKAATGLHTATRIVPGLICTGDLFVSRPEEQQRIKQLFPQALAVDMETCAIAQVCHLHSTPFISFRIISDTPGEKDNIAQYQDFWKTMADTSFSVTRDFLCAI